jgi:hypothetical protein
MGAKHRMTDSPQRRRPGTAPCARRSTSWPTTILDVASVSVVCAASLSALAFSVVASEKPSGTTDVSAHGQLRKPQPVSQEGTLIAVSAESVTARSANGYTQTYRVSPNTTLISGFNAQRGQLAAATARFKVNDEVEIVGTIQGGTALATAVAHRDAGHGDGPPMDHDQSEPVTGALDKA